MEAKKINSDTTVAKKRATFEVHENVEPKLFNYYVNWRPSTYHAGGNLARHHGNGADFSGFTNLLACPNPRRIDIRASARVLPHQWMVRTYFERSSIKVFVIVDVSSSMHFGGKANIRQLITELVASIACSTIRQGDAFGMIAANRELQPSWQILSGYQASLAQLAAKKATDYWRSQDSISSSGRSAQAVPEAIQLIGLKKSLVFLISDFFWPDDLLVETLTKSQSHDLVPIVLRDEAAFEELPDFGWVHFRDMENQSENGWLLRPSLHHKIKNYMKVQRSFLEQKFQTHGARAPIWLRPEWTGTDMSKHLSGTVT